MGDAGGKAGEGEEAAGGAWGGEEPQEEWGMLP